MSKRTNALRLKEGKEAIDYATAQAGFDVSPVTDYQYRVNDAVDLFPTNRKFHDIKKNQRGEYPADKDKLVEFLKRRIEA